MKSKRFFILFFILVGSFFSLLLRPVDNTEKENSIQTLTSLSKLPDIAYSNPFLEQRVLSYKETSAMLYPPVANYTYWEYVYAP